MPVLDQSQKNIRALKRLASRFNQSSLELIQEYRRLEERADHVSNNLESAIALGATRPKISATGEYFTTGKTVKDLFVVRSEIGIL